MGGFQCGHPSRLSRQEQPMNPFDAAVYACLLVAMVMGFQSGLLRSLATIAGYLAAMPVAVAAAPWLALVLIDQLRLPVGHTWWLALVGVFLVTGIVLGILLRHAVSAVTGPRVSLPDRMAGSALGAVRIALLAVVLVLVFDRIIPPDRQPAFLADSRLRPILSRAGQQGLRSLPPETAEFIDRLKRDRAL
jgi:membrane protein required for colicin V production